MVLIWWVGGVGGLLRNENKILFWYSLAEDVAVSVGNEHLKVVYDQDHMTFRGPDALPEALDIHKGDA